MCLIYVQYSGYRYTQTASKTTSSMTGCWNTARVDFSSDICWPIESRSIFVMGVLKKKKKKRLEEEKNEWRAKWNTSSVATIFHSSGRSIRMRDSGAIRSPFPLQIKEASTAWCHFLWQSLIVSTPRFLFLLFLFIPRNLIMIVRFFLVRVYKEILRKSHAVPIALSFIVISWAGVGENRNLKLILWSSMIRIDN